jgi:hypothetical protein
MKSRKAFALRIDPDLFAQLEGWAQQEFRSVNGQIEFILREAVRRRRGIGDVGSAGSDETPERTEKPPPNDT